MGARPVTGDGPGCRADCCRAGGHRRGGPFGRVPCAVARPGDPTDATLGMRRREDGRAAGFLAEGVRTGGRVVFQLPGTAEHFEAILARPAAVAPMPDACLLRRAGAAPLKSFAVEKSVRERGPVAYKIPDQGESVGQLRRTGIGAVGEKDPRAAVPAPRAAAG